MLLVELLLIGDLFRRWYHLLVEFHDLQEIWQLKSIYPQIHDKLQFLIVYAVMWPVGAFTISLLIRCCRKTHVSDVVLKCLFHLQEEACKAEDDFLDEISNFLWEEDSVDAARKFVRRRPFATEVSDQDIKRLRKRNSETAGVSTAYLLSMEFTNLAKQRTNKENPTFIDMSEVFWKSEDPIGSTTTCPRDEKPGCALVDTLPLLYRRTLTHFLSWVWRYDLATVQNALERWTLSTHREAGDFCLFMCFFVNYQYRILFGGARTGSYDLEHVFETNLQRIRQVVALLDRWHEPVYLTRVWTIFEQFTAVKCNIKVTIVLTEVEELALLKQIDLGKEGLSAIADSLCKVDAASSHATMPKDEVKIKSLIEHSEGGFKKVNETVRWAMEEWLGDTVARHLATFVEARTDGGEEASEVDVERRRSFATSAGMRNMDHFEIEATGDDAARTSSSNLKEPFLRR